MDQLVTRDPEETLEPQECPGRTGRRGTQDSQGRKVIPASAEPQVPQASLGLKDLLVEWACQEPRERRACLASLAPRASLAYLERKEPKERRGRQVCLASGFPEGLETRETRGWPDSQEAPERRGRKAAPGFQECRDPQARRGLQAVPATQGALACLVRKVTKVSPDWTVSLASKEKQVFLGSLVPRARQARRGSPAVMESQGLRGRRANQVCQEEDSQDSQGPKETKVQKATWVSQDWLGAQESPDPKASQDSRVLPGPKDSLGCLVLPAAPWRGPKETEDLRDSRACQGFRDPWGLQDSPGWTD